MSAESIIQRMIAAGTPADIIADVAMALARAEAAEQVLEERRAKDRARKSVPRNSTESTESAEFQDGFTPSLSLPPDPQPNPTPAPENKTPARKGTRLPADWTLPRGWRDWAVAERKWTQTEAEAEGEVFRDYWHAKAGKDGAKLDWEATWRNWVRNSRRQPANDMGGRGPPRQSAWVSPC